MMRFLCLFVRVARWLTDNRRARRNALIRALAQEHRRR